MLNSRILCNVIKRRIGNRVRILEIGVGIGYPQPNAIPSLWSVLHQHWTTFDEKWSSQLALQPAAAAPPPLATAADRANAQMTSKALLMSPPALTPFRWRRLRTTTALLATLPRATTALLMEAVTSKALKQPARQLPSHAVGREKRKDTTKPAAIRAEVDAVTAGMTEMGSNSADERGH
ncbi:hypothetical protein BC831DRAFT_486134 [Entophlyctis helioformis]|nr:hypothetical protein BC831DRAFT_486134 [Entophlyctis helioformis]